jgi:RNA polymerase sigma factor (sigma-70 family)
MVRGRLGSAVNDFRRLWAAGTVSGLSDAQLLKQFATNRDEAAFDSLMARHGPLVWSVCRSILTDPHDVEDAFQASFLILVRKAQSLRVDDSLCGWLYRVSYRVAQEARSQRDLRRHRERAAAKRTPIAAEADRARDELFSILNYEINRLPEKYRLPIVLCELEGLTRTEAAGQLDWPPGTVATRLARGQDLLRQRMRRRLGDDAGQFSACLGGLVSNSVPPACREATAQAALAVASKGWTAAGPTKSALTLAQKVHRAMLWAGLRPVFLVAMSLAAMTWVGLQDRDRGTRKSDGTGSRPVTAVVEPSRAVPIRGRLIDSVTGKPIVGRVSYAPLKGNAHVPSTAAQVATRADTDDSGRFALAGWPGRGVLLVTARSDGDVFYPMLTGVASGDRRRGIALADDAFAVDAMPRPLSLIGRHAYKVIDVPQGRADFEINFDLALHRGRTVKVRVVDLKGEPVRGMWAFGLRHQTAKAGQTGRGDESFAVHDLDVAWPRRVFFYQPDRDLAGFIDLAGNEPGDVSARLSPCGSIVGRVVQRAALPLADTQFSLVYDDAQGVAHVTFPSGRWVRSADEAIRDRRTGEDLVPTSLINLEETSDKDGRFKIRHVVPGARYHLQVVIDNPRRRLGLKAPVQASKKTVHESAVSGGQVVDVGDVRIVPEELRGRRSPR